MHSLCKNTVLLRNSYRNFTCINTLVPFSTTVIQKPHSHNPLIVDFLINTFGFSKDKAISASSIFSSKISPSNLISVPHILKQSGFSDTHIRNLISRRPRFLTLKVDKTLKPKLKFFQDIGFSGSSLAEIILKNPNVLLRNIDSHLSPNINFLRSLLHSNENIAKALKRCSWLLSYDLEKRIGCNLTILRQFGFQDKQISILLLQQPRLLTYNSDSVNDVISLVEELGVRKDSGLFIYAVIVVGSMSRATMASKLEMYKSYGWSLSDIKSAFGKSPNILKLSEQKVRAIMYFLLDELRYEPGDIVLRPGLLTYSLERRLKPRNDVLKVLNSRGLVKNLHLLSVVRLSEEKFLKNYVIRYVDEVAGLQEAYMGSTIQR